MKINRFLLFFKIIFIYSCISSQTTYSIGSGTESVSYSGPTRPYYDYTLCQNLYPSSELPSFSCNIIQLSWYSITLTSTRELKIYLGNTSLNNLSTLNFVGENELFLVFDGTMNFNQGWNAITFDTPFQYDGNSNLVVFTDDNSGNYVNGDPTFQSSQINDATVIKYQDGTDPGSVTNQIYDNQTNYLPNIKFLVSSGYTADFIANLSTVCKGNSVDFEDLSSDGPSSWNWDFGDGNTSAVQNPIHTYNSPGTYSVSLISSNGTDVDTVVYTNLITVYDLPNINAGPDLTVCGGTEVTLNGSGGDAYAWDGGVLDGVAFTPLIGTTFFNLTGTDSNGCTNQDDVLITALDTMILDLIVSDPECNGYCNGYADAIVSGGSAPYSYQWNDPQNQTTQVADFLCEGYYTLLVTDSYGCTTDTSFTIQDPPILEGFTIHTPTLCNGDCNGSVTALPAGGSPPYSYTWTDSNGTFIGNNVTVSNLCIGSYYVEIIDDNGCNVNGLEVVNEPLPLLIDSINTNISCGLNCNSQVSIVVSGGIGPYNYLWNDPNSSTTSSLTNLCDGQYSVLVSDYNNCTTSDSLFINSSSINLQVNPTNVTCNGGNDGEIDININPAGGPYSFQWSNGQTTQNLQSLSAGIYSLTITSSSGCDSTINVPILQPPPLQTNINVTNSSCGNMDGTAELVVANPFNQPYNASWSNGDVGLIADSLSSGPINVVITDASGCVFYDAAMIGGSGGPVVDANNYTYVTCPGGNDGAISLQVTSQDPPYTVNWISGQSTEQINGLGAGIYEYLVEDQSGCLTAGSVEILQPDSIGLANVNLTNPTCGNNDGSIQVNGQGGTGNLTYIWDANTGSQIGSTAINLLAGTYTLNIVDDNSCVHTETILLNDLAAPQINVVNVNNPQCGGGLGGINISVSSGTAPYTYQWTTGSTTEDLIGLSPGSYGVLVADALGCTATEFIQLDGILPQNPGICLVTVDSTTQTNLLVWEKPAVAGSISHYNIHREGIAAGVYDSIATIPYDSLSQYTDTLANPAYRSWSYKITVVDTCGNESLPSPAHKTIHLTTNLGLSNVINLIWDAYAGFSYPTYYINRYHPSTGWNVIATIPSSLTSYTDQTPPSPSNVLVYSVEIVPPSMCTSTKAVDHNSSRSNRESISGIGAAPSSDFSSSITQITVGTSINFFDQSINNPTTWSWDFYGGNPSTSTFQNPTNITYNNIGFYDVRLIVSNANGIDTLVKSEYINVSSSTTINENGEGQLIVHPNPTQDQITIDIKGYNGPVNVEVYDLQGRLLENTLTTTVSLRKYERGIYVLKVSYGEITEEVRVVRD